MRRREHAAAPAVHEEKDSGPALMNVAEARAERAAPPVPTPAPPQPVVRPSAGEPAKPSKASSTKQPATNEPTSVAHPFLRTGGPAGASVREIQPLKMSKPDTDRSSSDAA